MKITVYTDCHYYTPQEIRCIPTDATIIQQENAFSIGDNFDRKGAEPSKRSALEREYKQHQQLFTGRFITGNHDVMCDDVRKAYLVHNGVLFMHGDIISWDEKKADDFRHEEPYQGYGAVKGMLAGLRKIWGGSMSKSEAKKAADFARMYHCKAVVYGHCHYKKVEQRIVDGIHVYSLPRGRTVLEV